MKRIWPGANVIDEGLTEFAVVQLMACQPGASSTRIQLVGARLPITIGPTVTLMAGPLFVGL